MCQFQQVWPIKARREKRKKKRKIKKERKKREGKKKVGGLRIHHMVWYGMKSGVVEPTGLVQGYYLLSCVLLTW